MVTGQAAGVAAGLCVKHGITPRELEKDVSELQEILRSQGAILSVPEFEYIDNNNDGHDRKVPK